MDEVQFAENQKVKALIETVERPYQTRLRQVVGSTKTPIMRYDVLETSMDNFVDDAVREVTHSNVAFTNGFRFSPPIAAGPITQEDLWNILPFDARLKSGRVSGKQIRSYLESEMELVYSRDPRILSGGWGIRPSGMTIRFTAGAPEGSRIRNVQVNGQELQPDASYTIGGCEQEGESLDRICRLSGVNDARYVPGSVHSALLS